MDTFVLWDIHCRQLEHSFDCMTQVGTARDLHFQRWDKMNQGDKLSPYPGNTVDSEILKDTALGRVGFLILDCSNNLQNMAEEL